MTGSSLNLKKKWPASTQNAEEPLSQDAIDKLDERFKATRKRRRKLEKIIQEAEEEMSIGWDGSETSAYAELLKSWAMLNEQEADFVERLDRARAQQPVSASVQSQPKNAR